MPSWLEVIRNALIVVLLAALVAFMPGGQAVERIAVTVLGMAFLCAIAYFVLSLYRRQRAEIDSLPDGKRSLLFGSVGLIAVLIAGYQSFVDFTGGIVVWLALVFACGYCIFRVIREVNRFS